MGRISYNYLNLFTVSMYKLGILEYTIAKIKRLRDHKQNEQVCHREETSSKKVYWVLRVWQ